MRIKGLIFHLELLLAKLEDEFKHEVETGVQQSGKEEQNVKDVMKSGGWDVKDVPGDQEVVLSKAFGNEKYVAPC